MEEVKIVSVGVIAELSDGTVRQVFASNDMEPVILEACRFPDGSIKCSETILHGVTIEEPQFRKENGDAEK